MRTVETPAPVHARLFQTGSLTMGLMIQQASEVVSMPPCHGNRRLARLPLTLQRERQERHELAALARSMQGMRNIAQRNIQVVQRSAASVERMQHEALRFVRKLGRD